MRSLLFVPGDSPRKIEKAMTSGADALILDLEDSVAAARKAEAREIVRQALAAARSGAPLLLVRVNPLDSGLMQDDVAAVLPGRPYAVVQPKTRSAADVRALASLLYVEEMRSGLEIGATRIIVIATETATSIFHIGSYREAGPRLAAMTWGAEDLSADLGASATTDARGVFTDPYRLARTLCLFGAVAAGVDPVDTVHVDFRDDDGLRRACADAARDGFTGKLAIHPAQVPIINAAFTPDAAAIDQARRIVEAFDRSGGAGVIGLDGVMLDRPHLLRARKLLARAGLAGGTAGNH